MNKKFHIAAIQVVSQIKIVKFDLLHSGIQSGLNFIAIVLCLLHSRFTIKYLCLDNKYSSLG